MARHYTIEDAGREYTAAGRGYPASYHNAVNHLVRAGAWTETAAGRSLIARALVDLRAVYSRQFAAYTRRHMLYICGMFPSKGGR